MRVEWTETRHGNRLWELFTAWNDKGDVGMGAQLLFASELEDGKPAAKFILRLRRTSGQTRRRTKQWEWEYRTFEAAVTDASEALRKLELPK